MSAEQVIHATWEGDLTLTDIIPASRFVTGWQEPDEEFIPDLLPFATLARIGKPEKENTSSNTELATVRMRFDIWTESLSDTKAAADRIEALYRKYGAQWSDGQRLHKVLNMTFDDRTEERQADGVWHASLEADVLTERNF